MAALDVLDVGGITLLPNHIWEIYDFQDEADYPANKNSAWFYTVVPDPHELPDRTRVTFPSSSWFQIDRAWSGLWTDDTDPANKGTLSRCVRIRNIGPTEASCHILLSIAS